MSFRPVLTTKKISSPGFGIFWRFRTSLSDLRSTLGVSGMWTLRNDLQSSFDMTEGYYGDANRHPTSFSFTSYSSFFVNSAVNTTSLFEGKARILALTELRFCVCTVSASRSFGLEIPAIVQEQDLGVDTRDNWTRFHYGLRSGIGTGRLGVWSDYDSKFRTDRGKPITEQ